MHRCAARCLLPADLRHCVDVLHQAAFQVGGFVAVDVAALGEAVDHADNLWQKRGSFSLVFQIAQVFDGCAGRFFVVTVLQTTLVVLADALKRGTMVCHIFNETR